jgi:hypothetical protein
MQEMMPDFFRYSKSIYGGQEQLIGASWDLLPWFASAGVAFIVLHALVVGFAKMRSRRIRPQAS